MPQDIHFKVISMSSIFHIDHLITWLIVGLIAGGLAGWFVRGRGFGCIGNIIVGLIGAFIGGILVSVLELGSFNFCGSIFVSFIGSVLLLFVLRFFTGGSRL